MIEVKTNRSYKEPEHRLQLTSKQVQDVITRFKYMRRKWKCVKLPNTDINLRYRKEDGVIRVGFEEGHYGVANDYYTLEEIKEL